MGQQFVAFLGRGVEAYRVINFILRGERNLFVAAIHRRGGSVNKVLHRVVAAGFQKVIETDDVRFDINIRMIDGVAYTCLGSQVDHDVKMVLSE